MINAQYAIAATNEQKYPVIQADTYQPKKLTEEVSICLSESSVELLSQKSIEDLDFKVTFGNFGGDDVTLLVPQSDIQWCFLAMPKLFLFDKETKEYSELKSGVRLAGTKKVTAAKLFMCGIVNNSLLLDNDGIPHVFTLNLKSNKTRLIKEQNPSPDDKTLHSFNASLNKRYSVKGWIAHLVGVNLLVHPEKFTSSTNKANTSIGIKFSLGDKVQFLNESDQKLVFDRLQDPELQSDMKDPYNLASQKLQSLAIPLDDEIVF